MFQFTHPGKGATSSHSAMIKISNCFNSRTLGRVRLAGSITKHHRATVSIHAPWEGCDSCSDSFAYFIFSFNSRTLGRVRQYSAEGMNRFNLFQFTHPGKGATSSRETHATDTRFQFTHPGKGATTTGAIAPEGGRVSIHAPWEGCDIRFTSPSWVATRFNSRTLGRVRQHSYHSPII